MVSTLRQKKLLPWAHMASVTCCRGCWGSRVRLSWLELGKPALFWGTRTLEHHSVIQQTLT